MNVNNTNQAPTATATNITTPENITASTNINVSDPDLGDTFTYAITGVAPSLGVAVVDVYGVVTYTPTLNLNGTDNIEVTVTDSGGLAAVVTIGVTISAVNSAPTASTAVITTAEDTASVAVTPTVVDPDVGDTFTFTILAQGANGVASIVANQLVYTPNLNVNGTDNFTYTVKDAAGLTVAGTANVTVTAINDAPVISLTGAVNVYAEAGLLYTDLGATASDIEDGNVTPLIVTTNPVDPYIVAVYNVLYNVTDSSYAAAVQVSRQVWVQDTTAPLIASPLADVFLESALGVGITATIPDPAVTDAVGVVSIISNAPLAPTVFPLGLTTITWNASDAAGNAATAVSQNIYVVDTTAPVAPVISSPAHNTYTNVAILGPQGTSESAATIDVYAGVVNIATVTAVGTTWSSVAAALADGTYAITAYASDAAGNVSPASAVVSITVDTIAPTAPVINVPVNPYVSVIVVSGYTSPALPNAVVTVYDAYALPAQVQGTTTTNILGDWTFTDPYASIDGSYVYQVTLNDLAGNISPASPTLTLYRDTLLPTIVAAQAISVEAIASTTLLSVLNISPYANPAIAPLAGEPYALDSGFGYLLMSADVYAAADPYAYPVGVTTVTWSATDAAGNQVNATQTVTITDTTPPILSNALFGDMYATANIIGGISSSDALILAQIASITAYDLVDGYTTVTHNAPAIIPFGFSTIDFYATDSSANQAIALTAGIQVSHSQPAWSGAYVSGSHTMTLNENTSATLTLTSTDADGDAAIYSVLSAPTSASVSVTGSSITYSPYANFNGLDYFALQVSDGYTAAVSLDVYVTVNNVNNAPVITGPVASPYTSFSTTLSEDTYTSFVLTATDADIGDAYSFVYSVSGVASNGTATMDSYGTLNYAPNLN
ncbi:MAG: tandem-95 repeat protein, partial [Mariprofundaceae bacterium]|nr:tandem-95 repeat protein [Mariprofundaceae bacterium]